MRIVLCVFAVLLSAAPATAQTAVDRYKAYLSQSETVSPIDYSRMVQSGRMTLFRELPDRFDASRMLVRDSARWHLLEAFRKRDAISISEVDHECHRLLKRNFVSMDCISHDRNELGHVEIKVLAPERLKVDLVARREVRLAQAEHFNCPDGYCIYAYVVFRNFLSNEGKAFCASIPARKDDSGTRLCAMDNVPVYWQGVRVVSEGAPSTWKTLAQRSNDGGPFLDEWSALRALKLPPNKP